MNAFPVDSRHPLNSLLRASLRGVAVATLFAVAGAAHAGDAAVEVGVGAPMMSNAVYTSATPVAAISVRGGGGYHGGYRGGYRGGYYRGGGWGWGVGLGVGIGLGLPWIYPDVVYAQPSTVIVQQPPETVVVPAPAPVVAQPSRPEPVIYPRNGQSPQQQESDRQACNRWATTQQAALSDSTVFMRAVDACMDGRGYTTR